MQRQVTGDDYKRASISRTLAPGMDRRTSEHSVGTEAEMAITGEPDLGKRFACIKKLSNW